MTTGRTCTIITGEPNEFVREIHTRERKSEQLRRPPEAHLDWGMKTPGGQFRFNFILRMCRSIL